MQSQAIHHGGALECAKEAALAVAPRLAIGFGRTEPTDVNSGADAHVAIDNSAEEEIVELLSRWDPNAGFETENSGVAGTRDRYWLVDAIGGTGHYVRGSLWSSTMVALVEDGVPVVAVINDFVNERLFCATSDGGAFCNGEVMRVSDRPFSGAYVACELTDGDLRHQLSEMCVLLSVANYGWCFTSTAMGSADGFVSLDPPGGPWDFAPGALLVQEAGGLVTNVGSDTYDVADCNVIAASRSVHSALSDLARTWLA
jgi:myo-inositol-1(or 4)-monophosphatase